MTIRFPFTRPLGLLCIGAGLLLGSCLPGESDVAEKYNNINERAQIENTGMSLMQAANDLTGYLVAKSFVIKAPLDDIGVTALPTVPAGKNPKPSPPPGVQVVECGSNKMGALAYFTANPKGVPPLKNSSATMVKALSQRFGASAVGMAAKGSIKLPKVAEDVGCTVGSDILEFSPIFASGFEYKGYPGTVGMVLPDAKMSTQPSVVRDITLPCPTGYNGVIKREQVCKLIPESDPKKKEKVEIKLGYEFNAPNDVVRLTKTWDCNPSLSSPLAATADEITEYCIDPKAGLAKQADNTINMSTDSLKKILETGSGVYDFKCRQNANGTTSCNTNPYTPPTTVPRNTTLRCDPQPVPEQYVINPIVPIEVDANGKVISETPAAAKTGPIIGDRSCGQGWTGDLIAGYQVRACRLVKVVDGVETPIRLAQTIYKIGYVGARCKQPPKEALYYCPRPYSGQLTLRESNYMTKPLALQLGSAPAGVWSPSTIPWRFAGILGNANAETIARAAKEGYKIARWPLQNETNPRFSSLLEASMQPDMMKDITGCKLANQTCELPPDPIKLGIVFDRSGSMTNATLRSQSSRMYCTAELSSIFTDSTAACEILRNNARNMTESYGRPVESILRDYLIDPDDAVYNSMVRDAVDNGKMCGETSTDQIGYCTPGGDSKQSSCLPGTCVGAGSTTGTKLQVAEEQLEAALGYTPPGSEVRYTEFWQSINATQDKVEPVIGRDLCNIVTDSNCNFPAALDEMRGAFTVNRGKNQSGTPLMEATAQALQQFKKTDGGILLYFTDGQETDGIENNGYRNSYRYPYGALCRNTAPSYDLNGDEPEFCRAIGVHEGAQARTDAEMLQMLRGYYGSNNCTTPTQYNGKLCDNIKRFYDADNDKLTGLTGESADWRRCYNYGVTTRESVVSYITREYPRLKVFILNLGSRDLAACPNDPSSNVQLLEVDTPQGFKRAFDEAFKDLNTTPSNPQDVCTRVRIKYPNAVDY